MQRMLLLLAASALPILAIVFVTALLVHKLYINVRSQYDIQVNCWFCNINSRVPYAERSSWTCRHCEQYNGFTKDGDYNRDILQRSDQQSRNSSGASASGGIFCANSYYSHELMPAGGVGNPQQQPGNGFCDHCNEAQRLKVEKLAQFEPKNESRFNQELKLYKAQLEQQFRLCDSCERHVSQVLTEKKKMVLGSKFLNFVVKSAALLKQPHFNHLARVQQQQRLQRYQMWMMCITLLNTLCLLCSLSPATREQFIQVLGNTLGRILYFVYSHALTLWHVLGHYVQQLLADQPSVDKLRLYASTLGKLLLYSGGLTQPQAQQATFGSCFSSIYPYAMLALSFLHNICDRLRFSRFTLLLLLWSVYAEGSLLEMAGLEGITLLLLGNLLTLLLLATNRNTSLLQLAHNESVGDSFHRLCADECINDDETISLLSQQLSCSAASTTGNVTHSNLSHSQQQTRRAGGGGVVSPQPQRLLAPPLLSLDSLHLSTQRNTQLPSPTPSYQATLLPSYAASCYEQQQQQHHSQAAWPVAPSVAPTGYGWQRESRTSFLGQQRAGGSAFQPRANPVANHRPNLLLPSRLEQRNGEVSAWVNATCGTATMPELLEHPSTASLLRCCNEQQQQLSRTSSQSSGFESQTGNVNGGVAAGTGFWGNVQQQQQQQQQPTAPPATVASSDHGWGSQLRIPAPLPSPYSTQSEMGFGRISTADTAQSQQQELRPGDLLRRWMDRNATSMPKTNG